MAVGGLICLAAIVLKRRAVRRAVAGGGLAHRGHRRGRRHRAGGRGPPVAADPAHRTGGGQHRARSIVLASGAVDAAANVCYVLATRAGLFGLAVVITALYPGMTVLLARWVLGERMRWLQRAGLLLAAFGVVLLTR